ncbi:MAG: hypothetical protein J0H94_21040 [Rhizobiales bacterium]|nr:hypothetical protein [Hyphomicrobiales bacterium]MBN9489976.1 hypothetical protein [Alphaproteobacteria bacterium]
MSPILQKTRRITLALIGITIATFVIVDLGRAMAAMPFPAARDDFLHGIHRIAVAASTGLDPVMGLNPNSFPRIDYGLIEDEAIAQLKKELPSRTVDKLEFVSVAASKATPDALGPDTLTISIRLGYRRVKTVRGAELLGAIYVAASRPSLADDDPSHTSHFHNGLIQRSIPFPFLIDESGAPMAADLQQAERQSIGPIIQWINSSNI